MGIFQSKTKSKPTPVTIVILVCTPTEWASWNHELPITYIGQKNMISIQCGPSNRIVLGTHINSENPNTINNNIMFMSRFMAEDELGNPNFLLLVLDPDLVVDTVSKRRQRMKDESIQQFFIREGLLDKDGVTYVTCQQSRQ